MSYPISNVNILTETFESLIIRQNALAWLATNDILTANATGADTGNTTTSKIGRLYGTFMSNTVIVQDVLRGGNVTTSANLTVTSNAYIFGAVTMANTLAVTGNVSINSDLIIKTDLVTRVTANADIGIDTSNNVLIYTYPKTDFSTAKLLVQVKKGNNTQISEIIMAHNGSASELTVYGTVSSPASGNSSPLLATFTSNLNSANVELFILQTQANSSVKVVADLIR